ncbi:MAG: MacS family sensor histidine kinase [Motilibacteraceae bacterium]
MTAPVRPRAASSVDVPAPASRADARAAVRAVEAPLWRAVALFRLVALVYAVLLFARAQDEVARPVLGWAVLGAAAVWSLAVSPALPRTPSGAGRRWLLAADVVVATAAVLATALVDTPERIAAGAQTLPVIWPAAAVLACAVAAGPRIGLLAAVVVGLAGVAVRGQPGQTTVHNVVLLLLAGAIVGYAADLARAAEVRLAAALASEAAARERERLARAVHDGVLQVLALVQRRGRELGGEASELGRLAGEQEVALRALVSGGPALPGAGPADLRPLLLAHASASVTVSTPAEPVPLPGHVAHELAAAVGAALDNVRAHAPGAQAWVLLEDADGEVLVSVRDDGPGFDPARLGEAERAGRMGVARSIRGRLTDLGGEVLVDSAPGRGTEVELRLPRSR